MFGATLSLRLADGGGIVRVGRQQISALEIAGVPAQLTAPVADASGINPADDGPAGQPTDALLMPGVFDVNPSAVVVPGSVVNNSASSSTTSTGGQPGVGTTAFSFGNALSQIEQLLYAPDSTGKRALTGLGWLAVLFGVWLVLKHVKF